MEYQVAEQRIELHARWEMAKEKMGRGFDQRVLVSMDPSSPRCLQRTQQVSQAVSQSGSQPVSQPVSQAVSQSVSQSPGLLGPLFCEKTPAPPYLERALPWPMTCW